MAAHIAHPDVYARECVLVDGCPRCAEHAERPLLSLDPEMVGLLWREMLAVEIERPGLDSYPSSLDAKAGRQLYQLACWVERTMPALDPWRWPWGIRISFIPGGVVDERATVDKPWLRDLAADDPPTDDPPAEPDRPVSG